MSLRASATVRKEPPRNRLALTRQDYDGAPSTMCRGCGHDAITASIISACYESGVDPRAVIKLSGIGCSSKTTNYFMGQSFGFNATHGRMAALATGVALANHQMRLIGVSGDGDTASIGLGHFIFMLRRNLPITYIVENNGVYGLTKGQFSATADQGSQAKKGWVNPWPAIDLASLAISMGATYVARSFSGDRKQLSPLIQGALAHRGCAVLDVLSPCVTFNNHEGSTKSLKHLREAKENLHELDFIPAFEPIEVDYHPGEDHNVRLHDGSTIRLHKLAEGSYDPGDRDGAMRLLERSLHEGRFVTGLLYVDTETPDFVTQEGISEQPLASLTEEQLRPSAAALDAINRELMQ